MKDQTEIYHLLAHRKEAELYRLAVMPQRQFHQLSIVRWDNTPKYLWLHDHIGNDSDVITIHELHEAIKASESSIELSDSTSIVFSGITSPPSHNKHNTYNIHTGTHLHSQLILLHSDSATLPYEILVAHGPLHTKLGHGGFSIRKLKTRPSPSIGSDQAFYDFYLLPHLAVQLQQKDQTGRMVLGSRKNWAKLYFITYDIDKEEEEIVPGNENGKPDQPAPNKNVSSVPIKIVVGNGGEVDGMDRGNDGFLPFSCKAEGCGPDVKCTDAAPTRQCFLYNSEFLCCHQSPFS